MGTSVTLHVENTIADYDTWKAVFDKFDRTRTEAGVLSYRVTTSGSDPIRLFVDLDFASEVDAERFAGILAKVFQSPQSASASLTHSRPEIRTVREARTLAGTTA